MIESMIKTFKRQKGSTIARFVVIMALSLLTLLAISSLSQRDHKQGMNSYIPPDGQGLYEECLPQDGSRCFDRLKKMVAGGFKLVLNYDSLFGSGSQLLAYADQAQAVDMKVIWAMHETWFWDGTNLRSHFPDLFASCNCSDNSSFIRYVVNLVKNHPATWGYYIGDEVEPAYHAQLKVYADFIHQLDPTHPRLFIGNAEAEVSAANGNSPFYDTSEVIGDDHYPIGRRDYTATSTASVAHAVQLFADQHGRDSAMVLQSFSFAEYSDPADRAVCSPFPGCAPFPTKDQMQQMLRLALQNSHPRLILWYSYFDILRSDNPSGHWKDLIEAVSADQ